MEDLPARVLCSEDTSFEVDDFAMRIGGGSIDLDRGAGKPCAEFGVLHFDRARHVDPTTLEAITSGWCIGGPDDAGIYLSQTSDWQCAGLSIIDLASATSPCVTKTPRFGGFYGEIYNHAELRRSTSGWWPSLRVRPDTETIVQPCTESTAQNASLPSRHVCLCLWDRPKRRLFAAAIASASSLFYYWSDRETFLSPLR